MSLIEFDQVHAAYPGAAGEALRGITLSIESGEHVCILGGNGSGKSTLLQLVNALMLPSAGEVRVDGWSTSEPGAALKIRSATASVFQQPEDQMVTSVVADDVAFGPENLCVPQPEIARRVDAALAAVGMTQRAASDPADLSGGQMQRVALAGALAMNPRILLLDEPCAMLDQEGRADVRRIIAALSERGITIMHVTHFMQDALAADRVIALDRGRVAFDGAPGELFSQPELVAALGLEAPRGGSAALSSSHGEGAGGEGRLFKRDTNSTRHSNGTPATLHDGGAERSPHNNPRPCKATPASQGAAATTAAIVFEHASFSYANAANPRRRARKGLFARKSGKRRESRAQAVPLAVEDISFEAHAGTLTALIGHTGSGKSTTAELACALKLPSAGHVRVCAIDTCDFERRKELRRAVGYVAQLPERQLFAETVFDDVAFGPRNLGLDESEVDLRVREALSSVNLDPTDELLKRSPFALSGGQQRSVALAGVLAMRQRVLVLDEPMAGLDPRGRARLRGLLERLKREGVTLLMVTHSAEDVELLADQVIELDGGRVTQRPRPQEVGRRGTAR